MKDVKNSTINMLTNKIECHIHVALKLCIKGSQNQRSASDTFLIQRKLSLKFRCVLKVPGNIVTKIESHFTFVFQFENY